MAARRVVPPRLDGAGSAIADPQEAHQTGAGAAAGERLAFAAEGAEVGAGAGSVLEEPGLTDPEIHDAALADQIIVDGLDEAGVRLRVRVGILAEPDFAALVVDVVVTLGRTGDAVGVVEAGVEPLR